MNITDDVNEAVEAGSEIMPTLTLAMSILGGNPIWSCLLTAASGILGAYLQYNQSKLNNFVRFIKEHPNEFSELILKQPAFQEGFFISLEAYLKSRDEEKMNIIKKIFLGFATSEDKKNYELERLFSVVSRLSPEGIEYLHFISTTILPPLEEFARSEGKRLERPAIDGGNDAAWWENRILKKNEPITKWIKRWIHDEFDPNSQKVVERHGWDEKDHQKLSEIYSIKEPYDQRLAEMTAEFLSLGIFHTIQGVSGTIGGGSPDEQTFTDFGWKVLSFFEETKKV